MIDPRFAGEISMGVSAPTPRVRSTWGMRGDVTAPWDNYGRVSEVNAGTLPEVTISAPKAVVKETPKTTSRVMPRITKSAVAPDIIPNLDTINEDFSIDATPQDIRTRTAVSPTVEPAITNPNEEPVRLDGLNDLISGVTSLVPIMSNLFTSGPEAVPANYNPYATAITNTMSRRRYNIDPLLRDIETNRNVANYAASQQRTNTGQDMAFRLQNAIATNKAIAAARAAESNANNQYRAEYANTMNNLGQQWVQATNLASELNARNRAAARNIRRTGLSQLSQWAQNRELMSNQRSRDNAMLKLYDPFLQAGFTSADMSQFKKWLNKGGNK